MSDLVPRHLRVRPGDGRLCRTADALLFTPAVGAGWDELVAAIQAEEAGGRGVEPVAAVLAARGLEAPPLVFVTWWPRLAVLAFGDVELRSDHPALPLLTGRGSQTWVEHSVPDLGEPLRFDVAGPAAEDDTDLVAGVVPAEGFALVLARSVPDVVVDQTPAPEAGSAPDPTPAAERTPAATRLPPPSSPPPPPAGEPATVGGSEAEELAWSPPPRTSEDPDTALRAIQAAAVTEELGALPEEQRAAWTTPDPQEGAPQEGMPPEAAPPPNQVERPQGTSPTSDTVALEEAAPPEYGAPPEGDAGSSRPLVDAVTCPDGHPNPPGQGSCGSCDAVLPQDAPLRTVPRPALGELWFDDGDVVTVDADLVLGRRPPEDGRRRYALSGDRVSRHHAELVLRGWEVLLHDPGSRNGTYVVGPGSAEPVRVEAGVPVRLEAGARVYLGTRSFLFERPASSPAGSDDPVTAPS